MQICPFLGGCLDPGLHTSPGMPEPWAPRSAGKHEPAMMSLQTSRQVYLGEQSRTHSGTLSQNANISRGMESPQRRSRGGEAHTPTAPRPASCSLNLSLSPAPAPAPSRGLRSTQAAFPRPWRWRLVPPARTKLWQGPTYFLCGETITNWEADVTEQWLSSHWTQE